MLPQDIASSGCTFSLSDIELVWKISRDFSCLSLTKLSKTLCELLGSFPCKSRSGISIPFVPAGRDDRRRFIRAGIVDNHRLEIAKVLTQHTLDWGARRSELRRKRHDH